MAKRGYRDCPFCAEPVRYAAAVCPHCRRDLPAMGAPDKAKSPARSLLVAAAIIGGVIGYAALTGPEKGSAKRPVAGAGSGDRVSLGTWFTLGKDWFGCANQATQERLTTLAVSRDEEAFKRLMLAGVLAGECRYLKSGTSAYVEDQSVWHGLACLRARGETGCLWGNDKVLSRR